MIKQAKKISVKILSWVASFSTSFEPQLFTNTVLNEHKKSVVKWPQNSYFLSIEESGTILRQSLRFCYNTFGASWLFYSLSSILMVLLLIENFG